MSKAIEYLFVIALSASLCSIFRSVGAESWAAILAGALLGAGFVNIIVRPR